tara:strand:+ start:1269 stop:1547 length:279 start_codon:yes stop_codon:yes gene_type:complete
MENRNLTAFDGTLAGSPVTLSAHFGRASEWAITNLDASNNYTVTVQGTGAADVVTPRQTVTIRVVSDSITIDGAGDYQVLCAEKPGSIQVYW